MHHSHQISNSKYSCTKTCLFFTRVNYTSSGCQIIVPSQWEDSSSFSNQTIQAGQLTVWHIHVDLHVLKHVMPAPKCHDVYIIHPSKVVGDWIFFNYITVFSKIQHLHFTPYICTKSSNLHTLVHPDQWVEKKHSTA